MSTWQGLAGLVSHSKDLIPESLKRLIRPFVMKPRDELFTQACSTIRHDSEGAARKCFVDCGFNDGQMLRSFMKELPDFHFWGFELQQELSAVAEGLSQNPQIEQLVMAGCSDHDGDCEYYAGVDTEEFSRPGTTIRRDKNDGSADYSSVARSGRLIDLAAWLQSTFSHNDFVVVKMDIEGSEYDVLPHLVQSGAISLVHIMLVEFHFHIVDSVDRREHNRLCSELSKHCQIIQWY